MERRMNQMMEEEEEAAAYDYPFYTEGSNSLKVARLEIAKYSIARAADRMKKEHDPHEDLVFNSNWVLNSSEIGDDRPLSGCSFSHEGDMLATCSLNGVAKIWSIAHNNKLNDFATLKGHAQRATDVAFSPAGFVATASADCTARLWNTDGVFLNIFQGHTDRLARIAFHPKGNYLGTSSFDETWRLWDVETGEQLVIQEGHSRGVYGISFHPDGSLAGSCGLDAVARVWDLRCGTSVLVLEGHVKPLLGISFSPNGYHLATAGEDNTCKIWDLRKRRSFYTIPAHRSLISQVKFQESLLATASYDMTAKLWSSRDFMPIKTLSGHEGAVSSLDIVAECVATVSHDRSIHLWGRSQEFTPDEAKNLNNFYLLKTKAINEYLKIRFPSATAFI